MQTLVAVSPGLYYSWLRLLVGLLVVGLQLGCNWIGLGRWLALSHPYLGLWDWVSTVYDLNIP